MLINKLFLARISFEKKLVDSLYQLTYLFSSHCFMLPSFATPTQSDISHTLDHRRFLFALSIMNLYFNAFLGICFLRSPI
jgi:hypothetical protein